MDTKLVLQIAIKNGFKLQIILWKKSFLRGVMSVWV